MYELHVSARAEVARQRHAEALVEGHNRRLARVDEQVEPKQRLAWLAQVRRLAFAPTARPSLDSAA